MCLIIRGSAGASGLFLCSAVHENKVLFISLCYRNFAHPSCILHRVLFSALSTCFCTISSASRRFVIITCPLFQSTTSRSRHQALHPPQLHPIPPCLTSSSGWASNKKTNAWPLKGPLWVPLCWRAGLRGRCLWLSQSRRNFYSDGSIDDWVGKIAN